MFNPFKSPRGYGVLAALAVAFGAPWANAHRDEVRDFIVSLHIPVLSGGSQLQPGYGGTSAGGPTIDVIKDPPGTAALSGSGSASPPTAAVTADPDYSEDGPGLYMKQQEENRQPALCSDTTVTANLAKILGEHYDAELRANFDFPMGQSYSNFITVQVSDALPSGYDASIRRRSCTATLTLTADPRLVARANTAIMHVHEFEAQGGDGNKFSAVTGGYRAVHEWILAHGSGDIAPTLTTSIAYTEQLNEAGDSEYTQTMGAGVAFVALIATNRYTESGKPSQ